MNSGIKGQWEKMLRTMLADFRQKNPDDKRSDRELLESLMEHFVATGAITKKNGKFVIPQIVD